MILTWTPDFCPPGASCSLEIEADWSAVKRFVVRCPHHQSLGLGDADLFKALLQSSRVKEAARYEAKQALGLDKEHPGLPYTVDANGGFTILTGAVKADRDRIKVRADAEILKLERPAGTSKVTVA